MTVRIDRAQEKALLRQYRRPEVNAILKKAATEGGRAARVVMKASAPVGVSARLSQFYRRLGLKHGAFRGSVRAAPIRGRGSAIKDLQVTTIGVVIGPMGKVAFTRGWIESGTRHQRSNPWVEKVATAALSAARSASDAVLGAYQNARH